MMLNQPPVHTDASKHQKGMGPACGHSSKTYDEPKEKLHTRGNPIQFNRVGSLYIFVIYITMLPTQIYMGFRSSPAAVKNLGSLALLLSISL